MIGTASYMAPEQVLGKKVEPPADVYSLGLVLYEMLTGVRAFDGDSAFAVAQQQLYLTPPTLDETSAGQPLPPGLSSLVHRCISKQPRERPSDGAALVRALDRLASGPPPELASGTAKRTVTGTVAGLRGEPEPSLFPPAPTPALTDPQPTDVRVRRWRRVTTWSAVASLVGATVLLAWWSTRPAVTTPTAAPDPSSRARAADEAEVVPPESSVPPEDALSASLPDIAPDVPAAPVPLIVPVTSAPAGATVQLGDLEIGRTPTEMSWPPQRPGALRFELPGFAPRMVTISSDPPVAVHVVLEPVQNAAGGRGAASGAASGKREPRKSGIEAKIDVLLD